MLHFQIRAPSTAVRPGSATLFHGLLMPRRPQVAGMADTYTGTQAKAGYSQGGPGAATIETAERQGAHREVGSEGFAEYYRAVVEGATP